MVAGINVLLVDDHAVVRTGLHLLLSQSEWVDDVIEADTGEQAYQMYVDKKPDVVVMDLSLPGSGGIASIRKINARDSTARILVFSIYDELVYVTRSLAAGAKGYVTKSSSPEMMIEAVRCVSHGETYIEPDISKKIAIEQDSGGGNSILAELSAREFEVFCLIAKGYTTNDAAKELCLSIKTVANYATIIKSKLDVRTRSELTRLAYQHELLQRRSDPEN